MSTPYTVVVTREDGNWLADVPTVPGAHTFAPSLRALRRSIREVVILMDDLPDDAEVEVELEFDVEDPIVRLAAAAAAERHALHEREAELQVSTQSLVIELSGTYSVRDVADLVGLTHGRVSQILTAAAVTNQRSTDRRDGASVTRGRRVARRAV